MPDISVVGIFCEDIREEKTGQDTLIGILPDNMTIVGGGNSIPKLCLYVRIHFNPRIDPGSIFLRVLSPNDEVVGTNEFSQELLRDTRQKALENDAPITGLISKLTWVGFPVKTPGRVRALLRIGHDEELLCGALNFKIRAASSTSEQRPVQSPAVAPKKAP